MNYTSLYSVRPGQLSHRRAIATASITATGVARCLAAIISPNGNPQLNAAWINLEASDRVPLDDPSRLEIVRRAGLGWVIAALQTELHVWYSAQPLGTPYPLSAEIVGEDDTLEQLWATGRLDKAAVAALKAAVEFEDSLWPKLDHLHEHPRVVITPVSANLTA